MILRMSHLPRCCLLARAWWVLGSTGCWGIPSASKADSEASSTSTGSSTRGDPSSSSTSSSSTSVVTTSTSTTGFVDDTRGETGLPFLIEPDLGPSFLCDTFLQDCPPGEKCMLWSNDGGSDWNAAKCVPVVDDPAGVGEPCQVERWAFSGIDDCERGAMCWDVDPKTLEGACIPFCTGDEADPYCEDPNRQCIISSGPLAVCLPRCNPVAQDCPLGQACYPVLDTWLCGPDASGVMGGYGDPCAFINVCDPGLICLDESTVPPGQDCEGSAGCCTEVCDLSDPAGDQQCMGAAEGQTCQAWYEPGNAPPGLENVGACALPA